MILLTKHSGYVEDLAHYEHALGHKGVHVHLVHPGCIRPFESKTISNAQELTMQLSQTLSSAVAQIKSFKQPNYKSHNKDHAPAPSFQAFFFFFFFFFLPLAAIFVVEERV